MQLTQRNRGGAFHSGRSRIPDLAGAALSIFLILLLAILFLPQGESGIDSSPVEAGELAPSPDEGAFGAEAGTAADDQAPGALGDAAPVPATEIASEAEPSGQPSTSARADRIVRVFTGRVTSKETGAPIVGGRVSAYQITDVFFNEASQTAPPTSAKSATTDEDGRYRLELKRSEYESIPSGPELLRAGSEGFAALVSVSQRLSGEAASDELEREINFALPYGESITGRVVTTEAEGIPEAFVGGLMLREPDWGRVYGGRGDMIPSAWATADRNGYYRLEGVDESEHVSLPARSPGFIPGMSDRASGGASDVEIVLERGVSTLHGHIYDAEEQPLPGAFVIAINQGSPGDLPPNTFFSATADDEGYYRLEALPSGNMSVAVMETPQSLMGMMRSGDEPLNEEVNLPHGEELTKDFHFKPKSEFRGIFVEADSKQPIPGVRVSLTPYPGTVTLLPVDEDDPREEVVTRSDGRFEILVSGQRQSPLFYMAPEGYMPMEGQNAMIMPARGETGEFTEVVVPLRRGVVLTGRVVDRNSAPVAGATIGAVPTNPTTGQWGGGSGVQARSDNEGRFEITASPGEENLLVAYTSTAFGQERVETPQSGRSEEVTIRLEPNASIGGSVRTVSGQPVPGATVRAARSGPDRQHVYAAMMRMPHRDATTAEDGTYSIDSIAPGEVQVSVVSFEDDDYALPTRVTVTVDSGEHKAGVDFTVEVGDAIEGVVLNEESEPISGASVNAFIPTASTYRPPVRTDSDGYFRIGGLEVDAVVANLSVSHEDYQGEHLNNISALDGPQTIVLKSTSTVKLVVRDSSTGSPSPRYDYSVRSRQHVGMYEEAWIPDLSRRQTSVRNPEGRTEISRLQGMVYRVEVIEFDPEDNSPTGRRGAVEFDLTEGRSPGEVVVELAPGRTIRGRVVMEESGEAVEGAKVSLHQHHIPWMPQQQTPEDVVETDSSGRFEIPDVFPGTQRLRVVKEGLQPRVRPEVVVSEDRDPPAVEIALVGAAAIFGSVTGQQGEPLEGVTVTAMTEDEMWGLMGARESSQTTQTDEEGRYRIEGLQSGTIHMTAAHENGGTEQRRHVELAAGEELEVNFEIEGRIELVGQLSLNGSAPDTMSFSLMPERALSSEDILQDIYDARESVHFRPRGGGEHRAFVKPGNYTLRMRSHYIMGSGNGLVVDRVEVPAEPAQQDFESPIQTSRVEVVVTSLDSEGLSPFPRGNIRVSQRTANGQEYEDVIRMGQNSESMRLQDIPAGEYRIEFSSGSGEEEIRGESEWTPIGEGLENVIVVFVDADTSVEVGRWNPNQISEEWSEVVWDITPYVTEGGSKEFQFNYRSGAHALVVERAEIVHNGTVVSADAHTGWAGAVAQGTVYRLDVPSSGSVQLRARVRGHGGSNSHGAIVMRRR